MKSLLVASLLLIATPSFPATIHVGRFSNGDLAGWTPETFRGKRQTAYTLVQDEGRTVLRAESRQAASGLMHRIEVDPRLYPVLRWSWKIDHTLKKENARTRDGDDFAARVYVIFPGTFFWQTRAINYVWSGKLPVGTAIPNAYTKNAMIVAVESGEERVRQWVSEERNIAEDFRRLFGEEPPRLGGVAVMTDTDNTGEEAVAWYGDLELDTGSGRQAR